MAPALATIDDYLYLTGNTVDDASRVEWLLDKASALVRRECRGQVISAVNADTATMAGDWNETVLLPQFPVTNVVSVSVNGALVDASSYRWNSFGELRRVFNSTGSMTTGWAGPGGVLSVVYDHGYNPVPDDIVAIVCGVVNGQMSNPSGLRAMAKTIGQRSETITFGGAPLSIGTGLVLGDEEKRALRQYWRRHASLTMDIQPIDHSWPTFL